MDIECKYVRQSIDLLVSIVWGILSIIHFAGVIILLLNSSFGGLSTLFFIMLLFITIGDGILSVMYANMYLGQRNYISINKNLLIKDQGAIRPKKEINLLEVRNAIKIGNLLRLDLGDRREIKINLNCLTIEDIGLVQNKLYSLNIQF